MSHLKWDKIINKNKTSIKEMFGKKITLWEGWKRLWRRRDGLSCGGAWESLRDCSCLAMGSVSFWFSELGSKLKNNGFRVFFCNWVAKLLSFWEASRESWHYRTPFLEEKKASEFLSLCLSRESLGFRPVSMDIVNGYDKNDVVSLGLRDRCRFFLHL